MIEIFTTVLSIALVLLIFAGILIFVISGVILTALCQWWWNDES